MKSILILIILFLGVSCGSDNSEPIIYSSGTPSLQLDIKRNKFAVGEDITYRFHVLDAEEDHNSIKVSLSDNPKSLTLKHLHDNFYSLNFKPTVEDLGSHMITMHATAKDGSSETKMFWLKVVKDRPAYIGLRRSFDVSLHTKFSETFRIFDQDTYFPTFSVKIIKGPEGLNVEKVSSYYRAEKRTQNYNISWKPERHHKGEHKVILEVVDEIGRKFIKFITLNVRENQLPTFGKANEKVNISTGNSLRHEISYEDDSSKYSKDHSIKLINAPEGMSIEKEWSASYIIWSPKKEQIGEYKVTVVLTDKFSGSIKKEVSFKVIENQAPQIKVNDHATKTFKPKTNIKLPFTVKDPDTTWKNLDLILVKGPGDVFLKQRPKNNSILGDIEWTPKRHQSGKNEIVIKVTDKLSEKSVLHTFTLNIIPFTEEEKKTFALENWDKLKKEQKRKSDIRKKLNTTIQKKRTKNKAKKNWKKLKDNLTIVNKFRPKKRLPKEVTSQRHKLFNLKEIRNVIQFPKYTVQEKVNLSKQVQNVLLNHYVNLKVKIDYFGNNVDPTQELEDLVSEAKDLKEEELHRRISNLFFKLRDGHLNYYLPLPHGCFKSLLPINFSSVKNIYNEDKIILTNIDDYTEHLAQGISHANLDNLKKLKVGFTLTKYNGKPIKLALKDIGHYTYGANADAQRSAALGYLRFRNHRVNFVPKKSQVSLGFIDKSGNKININLPWLTSYNCQEEKDGTLISTYKRYGQVSGLKSSPFVKEAKSERKINLAHAKHKKGQYLNSSTIQGIGYLKVPTFSPNNYDAFDKEMRDFLKQLKNDGVKHLVIDVRDNGGGFVYLAEKLTQYLTREKTELSRYRFKNTSNNRLFFGSSIFKNHYYKNFIPLAKDLQNSDDYYSETTTIIGDSLMGKAHKFSSENPFLKIDILTNAKCYSACDTFVAQMQDHGSAKIWGVSAERTGAGGATVKSYSDFLRDKVSRIDGLEALPPLPGGQDMRFSILQVIRTKVNAGLFIENDGVKADEVIYFNEKEVLTPLKTIIERLGFSS